MIQPIKTWLKQLLCKHPIGELSVSINAPEYVIDLIIEDSKKTKANFKLIKRIYKTTFTPEIVFSGGIKSIKCLRCLKTKKI